MTKTAINSLAVDLDLDEIYYGFRVYGDDGITIVRDDAVSLSGEERLAALADLNASANAIAQAQVDAGNPIDLDVVQIIHDALYQGLRVRLGLAE